MMRNRATRDPFSSVSHEDEEEEHNVIKKTIQKFDIHDKMKPSAAREAKTKSHSGIFGLLYNIQKKTKTEH